MYSKAKIGGHPIHTMLVAFPITFYTTSLAAFLVYSIGAVEIFWYQLGFFCTFAGVGTAVLAAIPGFIDWGYGIPKESAANKRGIIHAILNVSALILFSFNAARLYGNWRTPPYADTISLWAIALVGVAFTLAAGYHGWELVATHKVGVTMTPEQQRLEPIEKMDRKDHEINAPSLSRPRTV